MRNDCGHLINPLPFHSTPTSGPNISLRHRRIWERRLWEEFREIESTIPLNHDGWSHRHAFWLEQADKPQQISTYAAHFEPDRSVGRRFVCIHYGPKRYAARSFGADGSRAVPHFSRNVVSNITTREQTEAERSTASLARYFTRPVLTGQYSSILNSAQFEC